MHLSGKEIQNMTQLKYQVPASGLAAAMENAPEDLDPWPWL